MNISIYWQSHSSITVINNGAMMEKSEVCSHNKGPSSGEHECLYSYLSRQVKRKKSEL